MTTPTKVHRQAPDEPRGVAVCGRKADEPRMTDDPRSVSCGVCLTWQADNPTAAAAGRNVIDRIADVVPADFGAFRTPDEQARARARARDRAHARLAERYRTEFAEIYSEELGQEADRLPFREAR